MTQPADWISHWGGTSKAIPWVGFVTTFQPLIVDVWASAPRGLAELCDGDAVFAGFGSGPSCF
ncbi:hypothetical protein ACWC2T_15665 [Streptomyces sp. NPDC001393]